MQVATAALGRLLCFSCWLMFETLSLKLGALCHRCHLCHFETQICVQDPQTTLAPSLPFHTMNYKEVTTENGTEAIPMELPFGAASRTPAHNMCWM
jgi:hypothetical protein